MVMLIENLGLSGDRGRETGHGVITGEAASKSVVLILTLQPKSFKHCCTLYMVIGLSIFTDPSSNNVVILNMVWTSYSGKMILGQHEDVMVQVQTSPKDSFREGEEVRIEERFASINPSLQ